MHINPNQRRITEKAEKSEKAEKAEKAEEEPASASFP
jgi:hypothetical protein